MVVLESVVAECDGCGVVVRGPVAPMFTHGWYCAGCAATLCGPTWDEVIALARNAADGEVEVPVKPVSGKTKVSREESLKRAWAALRAKAQERRAAKEKALTDQ